MKIKYRYGLNNNERNIVDFIIKQNIKYDRSEIITAFELFDDDENFDDTLKFLENHNVKPIIAEAVFSQRELSEAQWLSIRSTWRYGYPQPDDMGYIFSTYDTTDYCDKCRWGLVQKESFVIQKEPNWSSRNFLMINLVHDELFISSRAAAVLENSNLFGFCIFDVLDKSKNTLEGIKQIYVSNYLDNGLSDQSVWQKFLCSKCNNTKYVLKPDFIYYDKKVFENTHEDIIKSNEKFGETICASMIFISQRLYKIIKKNKLDRGLAFKPVKLI